MKEENKVRSKGKLKESDKIRYSVTKPGISNIARGVFTNISQLHTAFRKKKDDGYSIRYDGAIGFDKTSFHRHSLMNIMKSINMGESFALVLEKGDDVILYEITKLKQNLLI